MRRVLLVPEVRLGDERAEEAVQPELELATTDGPRRGLHVDLLRLGDGEDEIAPPRRLELEALDRAEGKAAQERHQPGEIDESDLAGLVDDLVLRDFRLRLRDELGPGAPRPGIKHGHRPRVDLEAVILAHGIGRHLVVRPAVIGLPRRPLGQGIGLLVPGRGVEEDFVVGNGGIDERRLAEPGRREEQGKKNDGEGESHAR